MTRTTAAFLLTSVLLTTCSQLLMKLGMISAGVRAAMGKGDPRSVILEIALSPWIIIGLTCFALSVGLWLNVLSKLNVSQAYPCVALGFVLTMLGGHFLFGEIINLARVAGLALIVAGVGIVAIS